MVRDLGMPKGRLARTQETVFCFEGPSSLEQDGLGIDGEALSLDDLVLKAQYSPLL